MKAFRSAGLTATVMRSWLSLTQICQGSRPAYLSGTFLRSTSAPGLRRALSPTELLRPPPPLSVM